MHDRHLQRGIGAAGAASTRTMGRREAKGFKSPTPGKIAARKDSSEKHGEGTTNQERRGSLMENEDRAGHTKRKAREGKNTSPGGLLFICARQGKKKERINKSRAHPDDRGNRGKKVGKRDLP